jgi:hypothetical protein
MYSSFLSAGQPGVSLLPLAVRCQPDGERLGEVLVGMALRVPRIQVEHEALAVGFGRVRFRIRLLRGSKDLSPLSSQSKTKRVVDRVSRLVAEDAHRPLVLPALHLEHLRFLELLEARMRQKERNGDRDRTVRREPFV